MNREALKTYDVLLTACALGPAPAFADCPPDRPVFWPIQSMPFNVTGNPALSMPAGLSASGLPLSAQLVGRPFDEATLLRVGRAVEKATASWGATAPALLAAE